VVGLPDGKKIEDMFTGVDRIPACDGQTDRQTSCDRIVRAMHTRRAVIRLVHTVMYRGKHRVGITAPCSDGHAEVNHATTVIAVISRHYVSVNLSQSSRDRLSVV